MGDKERELLRVRSADKELSLKLRLRSADKESGLKLRTSRTPSLEKSSGSGLPLATPESRAKSRRKIEKAAADARRELDELFGMSND